MTRFEISIRYANEFLHQVIDNGLFEEGLTMNGSNAYIIDLDGDRETEEWVADELSRIAEFLEIDPEEIEITHR